MAGNNSSASGGWRAAHRAMVSRRYQKKKKKISGWIMVAGVPSVWWVMVTLNIK